MGEFTESEKEKHLEERQKVEEKWNEMEEINNLENANQTDQLEALNLKTKSKTITYQERKTNYFRKMKYRECEKKYQTKHKTNTGRGKKN